MAVAFNEMTATLTTLNTELKTAKDRAERASKAKDEFLANVSHELRTPLNGIMGMTTVVLDTPISDEQREYMSIIDTSARGLLSRLRPMRTSRPPHPLSPSASSAPRAGMPSASSASTPSTRSCGWS